MNRREVLAGLGAALGVSTLSVAALARRSEMLHYDFGEIGAPAGGLTGSDFQCTAGTVTPRQSEDAGLFSAIAVACYVSPETVFGDSAWHRSSTSRPISGFPGSRSRSYSSSSSA